MKHLFHFAKVICNIVASTLKVVKHWICKITSLCLSHQSVWVHPCGSLCLTVFGINGSATEKCLSGIWAQYNLILRPEERNISDCCPPSLSKWTQYSKFSLICTKTCFIFFHISNVSCVAGVKGWGTKSNCILLQPTYIFLKSKRREKMEEHGSQN